MNATSLPTKNKPAEVVMMAATTTIATPCLVPLSPPRGSCPHHELAAVLTTSVRCAEDGMAENDCLATRLPMKLMLMARSNGSRHKPNVEYEFAHTYSK